MAPSDTTREREDTVPAGPPLLHPAAPAAPGDTGAAGVDTPAPAAGTLRERALAAWEAAERERAEAQQYHAAMDEARFLGRACAAVKRALGVEVSPAAWDWIDHGSDRETVRADVDDLPFEYTEDSELETAGLYLLGPCAECGASVPVPGAIDEPYRNSGALEVLGARLRLSAERSLFCDAHHPMQPKRPAPVSPPPPPLPDQLAALLSKLHDAWHLAEGGDA